VPNLARQSYRISILVATVVIAAQNLAIQYLDVVKKYLPPTWLSLVLTAGLTSLLYRFLIHVYETRGWRLFNRNVVLTGQWRHTLLPADEKPNNDRGGEFTVLQTAFETKIVGGKNYDEKTGRISHWKSLAVFDDELPERSLWVIYEIDRGEGELVEGESEIDRGLIRVYLSVDDKTGRMIKMSGKYWDAGKSQHKGSFEAARADAKDAAVGVRARLSSDAPVITR